MSHLLAKSNERLRGTVRVPGDKSISHRALMFGALAEGESRIEGFLASGDCLATVACVQALGVDIERRSQTSLAVRGRGLGGLRAPGEPLDCARSGTTMRLLAGILAGQTFDSTLTGDPQLLARPMRRITEPLRAMGARIEDSDGHAPLTVRPGHLSGDSHTLPVASAQVKSAILLAGLYADGPTVVQQPGPARDHTERMLAAMGASIAVDGLRVELSPGDALRPNPLLVPGDLSSAAFPLVAATLIAGSEITIEGVGINPTRTGLLDVLREMGARVAIENERRQGGEPTADVTARASSLHGVEVGSDTVVRMIDEFPILAVAATQAAGTTRVRDAAELRVKETDRIAAIVEGLQAMGAHIEPRPDGFVIQGPTPLCGARVDSRGDHRLAMALAVAGMIAQGETVVGQAECIADSFPGFVDSIEELGGTIDEMQDVKRKA